MFTSLRWLAFALVLGAVADTAEAGRVRNGNDLALDYVSYSGEEQTEVVEDATGQLHFFRYLKITNLVQKITNGRRQVNIAAIEPSSDLVVAFTVTKSVSLARIKDQQIGVGNGIAVSGRVTSIGGDPVTIFLDPVIVKHKDRLAPTIGKELLHEVDPNARYGTDTKTGTDEVLHRETVHEK